MTAPSRGRPSGRGDLGGRAAPAQATQGSAVIEGQDNTGATSRTGVFTTGNTEYGILADPDTSGKGSLGVYGLGQNMGSAAKRAVPVTATGCRASGAAAATGFSAKAGPSGAMGCYRRIFRPFDAAEDRASQVGAGECRVGEVGAGEVRAPQVGTDRRAAECLKWT